MREIGKRNRVRERVSWVRERERNEEEIRRGGGGGEMGTSEKEGWRGGRRKRFLWVWERERKR